MNANTFLKQIKLTNLQKKPKEILHHLKTTHGNLWED